MRKQSFLFQQELYADVDVVISVAPRPGDDNCPGISSNEAQSGGSRDTDTCALKRFPAHMAILSQSDFFHAQAQFVANTHGQASSRPVLALTLQDVSHVPALEAIISVLYGVQGATQHLQQYQLVHVVQYADMLQLESVAKDAVEQLSEAAGSAEGLTEQTLDALGSLVWPSCLLQLLPVIAGYADPFVGRVIHKPAKVQQILVAVLGNLEEVWSDEQLRGRLLRLPPRAMQLLLSSDQLSVYNEDTVLYTVGRYESGYPLSERASIFLQPLVRAPLLSDFQLTAQALLTSTSAGCVLSQYHENLRQLLSLRRIEPLTADMVKGKLPSAPYCWQLPARRILPQPADGVQLVWQIPVSDIKTTYQGSSEAQRTKVLRSRDSLGVTFTTPLCGMTWHLQLECRWNTDAVGVTIGVFSTAWCYPKDVYYKQVYKLQGPGVDTGKVTSSPIKNGEYCGVPDFFGLGVLRGDWEQSAWVSNSLPVEGHIELKLNVYSVI